MNSNSRMKVVFDTNVFIVSLSSHFKYYWIFEKLKNNEYDLCLSNEILTEYQEQLANRYGITETLVLIDFLLLFPNVYLYNPTYRWNLIQEDSDDNKFVDCAIVSNSDYIITNDRHFSVLKSIDFPHVGILSITDFSKKFGIG